MVTAKNAKNAKSLNLRLERETPDTSTQEEIDSYLTSNSQFYLAFSASWRFAFAV